MDLNGTLSQDTLHGLMLDALAIAQRAGVRLLDIYHGDYEVNEKPDNTPLTCADLAASELIEKALPELDPKFPVVSEEAQAQPFERRRGWQTYWLVDPLDGTREFIKRSGEFAVNIALIHGGRPVVGVIHAPVLQLSYYACAGGGAHKAGKDGSVARINVRNAPVTEPTVARSRSRHTGEPLARYLGRLGSHREIPMGSSLKSCLVAEGTADIYIGMGPTSEWDTAAAQCIVEEAGGKITDLGLQPLRYNAKESLLNPHFLVFGDASRDWSAYL